MVVVTASTRPQRLAVEIYKSGREHERMVAASTRPQRLAVEIAGTGTDSS